MGHNLASQGVAVQFERVSKSFRGRSGELQAVQDVSLAIAPGEFVSLLGPSGCGKSTILTMLAGLMPPTSGSVTIDGEPVRGPIDELGIVFQRDVLLEWRTVLDNVMLPIQVKRLNRQEYAPRAQELLELVGLQAFAKSYPHELSGGMRQRVAICRALIHSPRLLLMDEPFAALDALTREQLGADLLRIHSRYKPTVLFITHSIDEAVLLSDRVLLLSPRPARVVQEFKVDLAWPRSTATRRQPSYLSLVAGVRTAMEENGALRGA